jgi:hypothetical protein
LIDFKKQMCCLLWEKIEIRLDLKEESLCTECIQSMDTKIVASSILLPNCRDHIIAVAAGASKIHIAVNSHKHKVQQGQNTGNQAINHGPSPPLNLPNGKMNHRAKKGNQSTHGRARYQDGYFDDAGVTGSYISVTPAPVQVTPCQPAPQGSPPPADQPVSCDGLFQEV